MFKAMEPQAACSKGDLSLPITGGLSEHINCAAEVQQDTPRAGRVPVLFAARGMEGFLIEVAERWYRLPTRPALLPDGSSGPVWQVTYGRDDPKPHLWLVPL